MSLKAWYPFITDANNYGLGDLDLTQATAPTYISGGKIGSTCLNTGGFKWTAEQTASVFNNNELTIAFWIKVTGTTSGIIIGNSSMGESNNRKFAIFQYPNANALHWSWMNDAASTVFTNGAIEGAFPTNVWTHCCITYKNPNVKVYLNGTVAATASNNVSNSSTFAYETQVLHSNSDRCIQDLRFYDHALSAKEVKLLSQGLVAHYQLKGMGATNYLKGAGKFTKDSPLVRKASDTSVMNDSYVYHEWEPNALFAVLPSAGTYTISVECDGVGSGHQTSGTTASQRLFSFFLQNVSSGTHYHFAMSKGADGRWYGTRTDLVAGTYKVRSNLYAADKVDYTLKFWDMKVTAGAYNPSDTWCPHEEDELYNALGLGLGNEPDCSGFGHNATKSGILETVSDSPRYGRCYRFAGSQYIACGRGAMVTDELTVSCWAYSDNWTNASEIMSCAEGGGWDFWRNGSGQMTMEVRRNGGYVTGVFPTALTNWSAGWHHLVGVYDGYKAEIYVDGVKGTTSATTTTKYPIQYHESNGLFIAAAAGSSATTPANVYFTGNISDIRIYGTALSATDVADLYKNAASLTKDGKLMAYDFHENKRNAIDKDGVVATGGFSNKSAPTYDMKVKALDDGSTWARIHHLDVTNDKAWFATNDEVAKCTDKHNRFSRMGIVDRYKPSDGNYEFMLTYPSMKKTVPAGYTQLEYIEATGTQWINTAVTGAARWEFDIEFKTGISHRQLMGYGGDGGEYWGVQVHGGYGMHESANLVGVAAGQRDTVVHDFSRGTSGGNTLWVQNKSAGMGNDDVSSKQYQLFSIVNAPNYACHAKLYRCKCIQSGSLIRDFIPAMRNSDNVIGLYDVVNNVFYTNAGSGYFLCNYSWLDYIQSSGTQCINTGFTPAQNTRIIMDFEHTGANTDTDVRTLFGARTATASNVFGMWISASSLYPHYGNVGYDANGYINITDKGRIKYDLNGNIATVDNNTITCTSATFNSGNSLYLLAMNQAGTIDSRRASGRLYSCKIYDNGTLVRDYVPCNYGGSIGLWDKVNSAFYANAGSGTFTFGKGGNYQWLDYIQSSGTQYINTGLAENSVYGVKMVFEVPNYAVAWQSLVSGTLDTGFTIGTRDVDLTGFYVRLRGAEIINSGSLISGKAELVIKNGTITVNGSQKATYTAGKLSEKTGNLYIFANNALSRYGNMKLYELEFYGSDGGVLRSYVPCVSPSGKVGLYDKVTKRFYGNNGTGSFIAGTTQESLPLYNRWIQTSSPNVAANAGTGFKALTTSWTNYFTPITKSASSSSAVYSMNTANNWWAPIGQKVTFSGGIPAADGSTQYETELWVRTDRFANANQMKIYNGSIVAKDYIEI